MLTHRLRRCSNIKTTLGYLLFHCMVNETVGIIVYHDYNVDAKVSIYN